MAEMTDREKLSLRCKSTIQYHFGLICDLIKASGGNVTDIEAVCSKVRRHGNDAIRVIDNHLEYYNVSRNHRKDQISTERVVARVLEKG